MNLPELLAFNLLTAFNRYRGLSHNTAEVNENDTKVISTARNCYATRAGSSIWVSSKSLRVARRAVSTW